jgi:hypothetical protein
MTTGYYGSWKVEVEDDYALVSRDGVNDTWRRTDGVWRALEGNHPSVKVGDAADGDLEVTFEALRRGRPVRVSFAVEDGDGDFAINGYADHGRAGFGLAWVYVDLAEFVRLRKAGIIVNEQGNPFEDDDPAFEESFPYSVLPVLNVDVRQLNGWVTFGHVVTETE